MRAVAIYWDGILLRSGLVVWCLKEGGGAKTAVKLCDTFV